MRLKRYSVPALILALAFWIPAVHADKGGKAKGNKGDKVQQKVELKDRGRDKETIKLEEKEGRAGEIQIKHRGLDRNHDGVITRSEWPGSDRSFQNQDLNADGILTGNELRPGAQDRKDSEERNGNRGGRFADLDRNHDGVIGLNEWRATRRDFERFDLNRDRVITHDEFFGWR